MRAASITDVAYIVTNRSVDARRKIESRQRENERESRRNSILRRNHETVANVNQKRRHEHSRKREEDATNVKFTENARRCVFLILSPQPPSRRMFPRRSPATPPLTREIVSSPFEDLARRSRATSGTFVPRRRNVAKSYAALYATGPTGR